MARNPPAIRRAITPMRGWTAAGLYNPGFRDGSNTVRECEIIEEFAAVFPEGTGHQLTRTIGSEQICYYDRASGTPLVLIHGMFGDFLDWEPVLDPLASSHRVIALDLPGFGGSSKPRGEYSAEFFVSTLHEFFEQLQLSEFILAGNSFGGQIAILYALHYPDSVSKLLLVNSGGFRESTTEEKALLEPRFSEAALAALTPEINAFLFGGVFTKASKASIRYLEKQNRKLHWRDYPDYAYALSKSISLSLSTYLLDRLPELRCPTLLVWGENDQVLPVAQAELALTQLRSGQLKIIPGCGHAPQLECPTEFLRSIQPFLSSPRSQR
jgi:2-hydroxy-6-oxonona-2,4-dienedioate hydrolase